MVKSFPIDAPAHSLADFAEALVHARQTVLPKRLSEPGPDAEQLACILRAAAAAPDHRCLVPWRFILVPGPAREALAQVFAAALADRDALASAEQLERAREKAYRAPLLLLAVVRLGAAGEPVLPAERIVSAGCAIQNMLLMATALGFGSALTSGKALQSSGLRSLFGLDVDEQALCFLNVGTVRARKPSRPRPDVADYVRTLVCPLHGVDAPAGHGAQDVVQRRRNAPAA